MARKPNSEAASQLTPISPELLYPYKDFCHRLGMGEIAAQQARRRGLRVLRVGKVYVVLGKDAIEFFDREGVDDMQEHRTKQEGA